MHRKTSILFSVIITMALILSACASTSTNEPAVPTAVPTEAPATEPTDAPALEPTEAPAPEPTAGMTSILPEVDPASVSGDIIAAGSSTVYPLAEVMADRFKDEGFAGNITIDSIGSGAGFERFLQDG